MPVIVIKTAAWICFALGIVLAFAQYLTNDTISRWIGVIFWLAVMWSFWFFLLRAAHDREKRGD